MRPEIPILSFICLPLLLIPLPWHIRARNIATMTLVFCMFFVNLIHGVNAIVWAGSVVVKIPVWCDITTKFIIGAQVALPATSLCITRHLERVASIRHGIQTERDKRRRQYFELALCVGLPCIVMALHYVVQGHRFDISEDFGCTAAVYYSIPAIIILYVPPFLCCTISMVYAGMAFYWFMRSRARFVEHLRSNGSGLSASRYMRLMAMAVMEIVLCNGWGVYIFVAANRSSPLRVWDNWADVHWDFSRIAQYPKVLVPEYYWNNIEISWMAAVVGSLAFFAFFGFGQESVAEYKRVWRWVQRNVFRMDVSAFDQSESVLPTFSQPSSRMRVVNLEKSSKVSGSNSSSSLKKDDLDLDLDDIEGMDRLGRDSFATFQTHSPPSSPNPISDVERPPALAPPPVQKSS